MWKKRDSNKLYTAAVNQLELKHLDPREWSIVLMYNPLGGYVGSGPNFRLSEQAQREAPQVPDDPDSNPDTTPNTPTPSLRSTGVPPPPQPTTQQPQPSQPMAPPTGAGPLPPRQEPFPWVPAMPKQYSPPDQPLIPLLGSSHLPVFPIRPPPGIPVVPNGTQSPSLRPPSSTALPSYAVS